MQINFSGEAENWQRGYLRLDRPELFNQASYTDVIRRVRSYIGDRGIRDLNRIRGDVAGEISRGGYPNTEGVYVSFQRDHRLNLGPVHTLGHRVRVQVSERLLRLPNGALQRIPV